MNEKIKQFAINSQLVSEHDLNGTLISGWQEGVDLTEYVEDFANMIIKDCLLMCLTSVGNGDYNTGRMDCYDNIKEHFGIE